MLASKLIGVKRAGTVYATYTVSIEKFIDIHEYAAVSFSRTVN